MYNNFPSNGRRVEAQTYIIPINMRFFRTIPYQKRLFRDNKIYNTMYKALKVNVNILYNLVNTVTVTQETYR